MPRRPPRGGLPGRGRDARRVAARAGAGARSTGSTRRRTSSRCCSASAPTAGASSSPQGTGCAIYVPYGRRWYEYSLRRLQENPKVAGYVARDMHRPASSPAGSRARLPRASAAKQAAFRDLPRRRRDRRDRDPLRSGSAILRIRIPRRVTARCAPRRPRRRGGPRGSARETAVASSWASGSVVAPSSASVSSTTSPSSVSSVRSVPRRAARDRDDGLARSRASVLRRLPSGRALGERLEVGLHRAHLGDVAPDRLLDLLGDRVRRREIEVAREASGGATAWRPSPRVDHGEVVELPHVRRRSSPPRGHARGARPRRPRLDVDDDVALREARAARPPRPGRRRRAPARRPRRARRRSRRRRTCARRPGAAGAAGRRRAGRAGRSPRAPRRRRPRGAVHQDVDVPPDQPGRGGDDEDRDEQRRDRVALGEAGPRRGEARETASVPSRSAPKWTRVRERSPRSSSVAPAR